VGNYVGYEGGGLACDHGAPSVSDCVFLGNEGYMGGGGIVCRYSDADISHCRFESNLGCDGAGLFCQRSSPTVSWCTFLKNDALVWGGGIFCHAYSSPAFTNCTIVGNEAHVGGGLTTIYHSYPTLDNCIIAWSGEGEGVHCYDDFGDSTYAYLTCCDVYGNAGGGYSGWIDDQTGLNGNIAADPLFCGWEGGNILLASESACLPGGNDCGVLMGAWGEGCTITPVTGPAPARFHLAQNSPNPFNPGTVIRFGLAETRSVEVSVFSVAGRRVATLQRGPLPAGPHAVTWDGRDAAGRPVASGTYFYRLTAGDFRAVKSMVLLK